MHPAATIQQSSHGRHVQRYPLQCWHLTGIVQMRCRSWRYSDYRDSSGRSARTLSKKSALADAIQQPGDRTCTTEAIGGSHYGPVQAYLSAVDDSSTADGSDGWFKIYADTWAKNPSGASGDDDYWGTKDINTCCGRLDVKIPSDIQAGDYLLRAEALALHTASSSGGAQFYMSCIQLTITGSGSASPSTVSFPGAYAASDPGILVDIHAAMTTYIAPGPTVYSGGSTKSAGAACEGCETTCTAGAGASGTATSVALPTSTGGGSDGCTV
jgi:lytic cellulose monooxygenase (C1-hydroxylating)